MKIKQIENYIFSSAVTFTDNVDKEDAKVTAYGPVLAKIISVLRTIGWVLTAGYCFKEVFIYIPYQGSKYYLHPDQIQSARLELGECQKGELFTVGQSDIEKMIINLVSNKSKSAQEEMLFGLDDESRVDLWREGLRIEWNVGDNNTRKIWITKEVIMRLPKDHIYYVHRLSTPRWKVGVTKSVTEFEELYKRFPKKKIIVLVCYHGAAQAQVFVPYHDPKTNSKLIRSATVAGRTLPVWPIYFYHDPKERDAGIEKRNLEVLEEGLRLDIVD